MFRVKRLERKATWFMLVLIFISVASEKQLTNQKPRNESHSDESTRIDDANVIFLEKIFRIRPKEGTAMAELADVGNHSNYVRTAAVSTSDGNSKPPDPNTTSPDLFKDEGNETGSWNLINSLSDGKNGSNGKYSDDKIKIDKHEFGEPYYEAPQMLKLDDCQETNPKSYRPLNYKIQNGDMERNRFDQYSDITSNSFSKIKGSNGLLNASFYRNTFARRADNYEKSTISHLLLTKLTKSIVERDISNDKLRKPKPVTKVETITKPTFMYNPTIVDSSDENYSEYEDVNMTIDNLATESIVYESMWQESENNKPKIRFSELPQRETYITPTLKLEEGASPFGFVSSIFTIIYPYDVPIGLLRDILWGKFSFPSSMLKKIRQSVRLESRFIACVVLLAACALLLPTYLACRAALALCARGVDGGGGEACARRDVACGRRLQLASLVLVMAACGVCTVGMALSSEGGAWSVREAGRALRCGCADVAAWTVAAARDLRHALEHPTDLLLAHYKDDLTNVEPLLGEPIRKAIASESGIDLVLESVNDISTECAELSRKIHSLRELCVRGAQLALATQDRLRDLSRQLDTSRRQCLGRDAALCETIQSHGLDLNIQFDLMLHEQQLLQLRALGAENLTRAVDAARAQLRALPATVADQTLAAREEIARVMESRRDGVHSSSRVLGDMVRHLSAALQSGSRKMHAMLTQLREYDAWRWSFMLGCAVASCFVVALTASGALCGCCSALKHARRLLQVSTCWMFFVSLAMWTVLSATFLVAGHAEVYLCRALWDDPEYSALSALLDRQSSVEADSAGGILHELFRDLDNVTVDVPIRDVIRECKEDQPAYSVFRLERVLDISKETAYFEWSELQNSLKRLSTSVDVGTLRTMSVNLTRTLEEMLKVSYVDMAYYRLKYNGPLVGKDLTSLAEQLENVATQLSDLTTSSRVEALASRTRRLLVTSIGPLEQLRTELVYRLTELELQLLPFHRQLNTSLSHIRTMQYYVDNQGDLIAQKKVLVYTKTLESHTAGWRTHALSTATVRAARCRPLHDIFSSGRALLCSHYVASLHGFWLCALCCALLWCYATPCCLQLCRYFDMQSYDSTNELHNLNTSQQEIMTICDDSWNFPRPPPPHDTGW